MVAAHMIRHQRYLLPFVLLALAACGTESGGIDPATGEPVLTRGTSPLEDSFEQVATEYQVPVELLKGIAWVETRVQSPGTTASMTGGYGLMNLVDREDWNGLERGAALTGSDRGRIKLEETSNLRAAAAFLRELADKSFADFPNLNPHDPADWWHAVSLYPGLDSATGAVDYAAQVFRAIDQGFEVSRPDGTVVQPGIHFDWHRHAPVETRKDAAKEYPGAYQWKASPNYSKGRSSYQYIVIHTVQGSYSSCINTFLNKKSSASSHYVVRSSDGQVTQMVEHGDTAWHASCYNSKSIGIEHEGFAQNPSTWYTDAMYRESAKLTRWIADRHQIPKTRSRIIGHVEVPSKCNANAHWDPGTGWNWTKYMGLVTGSTPGGGSGTGVLKGVIYSGGNTNNRVSGAKVSVAGQEQTTGSDGAFSFTLTPGTHSVSVSKSGFTSNSVSRTVTDGAIAWGSMEINTVSDKGTLTGVIYQGGDTGNRVSGATVTAGGQTATTGADGLYEFSLAPGTYTVSVSKSGYSSNSLSRTVSASGTSWGSMEINAGAQGTGTIKGAIYQNGDTANRVSGVTVSVNGQNKSVTTGADGIYEFSLAAGSYTLTASKAGYQNATVTRTLGAGTTVWGSMELKTGTPGSTDTVPPTVEIMFPGGGVALDLAVLTLTGTATDDQGALSEVTVSINQGAPAKAGVTGGKFSQQIKLFPGLNTIEVSATDAAGNTAVDSAQATFRAGVSGFVHVTEDEAARIPDVTVRLLRPSNGEVVGTAVSGADGSFSFDVSEVNVDFVLTVKAQGFLTRAETVTISDEERVSLHIPMTEGEDPNPSDVDIRFIEPVDGATVTGEQVTVYGSVDGFPVVAVVVNEVTAELVGAGGFAASIPLKEGENTIEALATGVSGETIVGTIKITRRADGSGGANAVKGGCAAVPGLELFALLAALPLLRRRRQ